MHAAGCAHAYNWPHIGKDCHQHVSQLHDYHTNYRHHPNLGALRDLHNFFGSRGPFADVN